MTKTSFVILMHPREAKKERTGTGRLAHLCLEQSRIQVGIDFLAASETNRIIEDPEIYSFLLYPGEQALDLHEFPFESIKKSGKKPFLFVLDGTWTAAKKMMKMSRNLHNLPRYVVQSRSPSRFIIKRQPYRTCLSTIESIYYYLEEADRSGYEVLKGRHQVMMDILDRMVAVQLDCTQSTDKDGYRRNNSTPLKEQRYIMRKKSRRPF